jgi:hypothetical protein
MKKKIIWILIVVIIIILVALIFSYPIIFSLFSSSNCGNEFNKAFNDAVKNNNLSFCSNYTGDIKWGKNIGYGISCNLKETKAGIRVNDFQDSCLGAMAYSTKNIEFCKLIQEENSKGSCVLDIARNEGDISYCEVLEKTNGYYGPCIGNNEYKP